jgi:hypothetical protein
MRSEPVKPPIPPGFHPVSSPESVEERNRNLSGIGGLTRKLSGGQGHDAKFLNSWGLIHLPPRRQEKPYLGVVMK